MYGGSACTRTGSEAMMGSTKADVTAKSAAKVNMSIKPPILQGAKERVKPVADQKIDTGEKQQ